MERDTPGWRFYQQHLDYIYSRDLDGLVQNDYNEDAVLMSTDSAVRGREAVKKVFEEYLARVGDLRVTSTEEFNETDDCIQLEATIAYEKLGMKRVYDVFVLKDGKISYHFNGQK